MSCHCASWARRPVISISPCKRPRRQPLHPAPAPSHCRPASPPGREPRSTASATSGHRCLARTTPTHPPPFTPPPLPSIILAPELPGKYVWTVQATLKSGSHTETRVSHARFEVLDPP